MQAVIFCAKQLYFKEAVFALKWTIYRVCCSEQASLLLLRTKNHKQTNETTRAFSCYMLVHGWPVLVSSKSLYSTGSATNWPQYPRKYTVSSPGIRVEMGKGRGAYKSWALISAYCSICRLRKLKQGKENKHSSSLVCDNGLQLTNFTVKRLKTWQECTTSSASDLLNWLKNWCQESGSEQTD